MFFTLASNRDEQTSHLEQQRTNYPPSQVGQSGDWRDGAVEIGLRHHPFSSMGQRAPVHSRRADTEPGTLAGAYSDFAGLTSRGMSRARASVPSTLSANESENAVSGWAEPEEGHKPFGGARVKSSESSGDSACHAGFACEAISSPALRDATVVGLCCGTPAPIRYPHSLAFPERGSEGVFPAAGPRVTLPVWFSFHSSISL